MIYGDDVTHLVTEEGVAYLYKTEGLEERKAAIAAIAGAPRNWSAGRSASNRRSAARAALWQLPKILESVEPTQAEHCGTPQHPGKSRGLVRRSLINRPQSSEAGEVHEPATGLAELG